MKKFLLTIKVVPFLIMLALAACSTPASMSTPIVSPTVPAEPTRTLIPQPTSNASVTLTSQPTLSPTPQPTLTATDVPERIVRDLEYIPDGRTSHKLDVYLPPTGDGPFPTILAIHGGGFSSRSKDSYRYIAPHYMDLGYALVSTNYRLTPGASYPAQVQDVFCALAWIYANHEEYGFDVEHVFVTGGSAGGYLASMVGTVDNPSIYLKNCPHTLPETGWVQGMIIFYGFFDFTNIEGFSDLGSLQYYWRSKYEEIPLENLEEMSPMSWLDGSEPPTLLIHGTLDESVPSWMSEGFAAALEQAGADVELILVEAEHGFESGLNPLSKPAMVESFKSIEPFLSRLLAE